MTLIVGFRKSDHNLLLSADSRITFKRARVDDLQKLYMPTAEVAVGFAGQSVSEIQQAFRRFNARVQRDEFSQPDDSLWDYNDRILRVFRNEVSKIESITRLIFGVAHKSRPDANILKLMWVENEEIDQEVDIPPGEFRVAGSAFKERDDEYLKSSLGQAFEEPNLPPEAPDIDVVTHAELLSTQYSVAWKRIEELESSEEERTDGLKTAGPVLHTVLSKEGQFFGISNTTETVFESEGQIRIESRYNETKGCFEIVNHTTEEATELYSVEKYSFEKSNEGDDLFDVSLRTE